MADNPFLPVVTILYQAYSDSLFFIILMVPWLPMALDVAHVIIRMLWHSSIKINFPQYSMHFIPKPLFGEVLQFNFKITYGDAKRPEQPRYF